MYFVFDIGGTQTRFAISDGKSFIRKNAFATPQDFDVAKKVFSEKAKEIVASDVVTKAGGGIPGVLENGKKLVRSPNLPLWIGRDIRELFTDFNCEISLENDAAICGLGEAVYGAGKDYSIVEYLTVSTGVGGARIVDKKIDEKSVGFEPGQELIATGTDSDGGLRTLENTVSGKALEKQYGKKPKEITDPEVWVKLADELAVGVYNTVVLWSPDVVVLGGSMITGSPAIPVEQVEKKLKEMLKIFPKTPIIKKAELGNEGGLWGALHFILS
jgi:predicted NBD/HSP70 family sugar kinase